jgi:transcriptional regulator with XRE-family HTH domain
MEPDYWSKVIGLNVWVCRKSSDMTQRQLADAIGSTTPAVSRLESGGHLPSLTTLLRVAEALAVTPCRLLTEPRKPKGRTRRG